MTTPDPVAAAERALPAVRDASLSPRQQELLQALERRVQLHFQAERNPTVRMLTTTTTHERAADAYVPSVKSFLQGSLPSQRRRQRQRQVNGVYGAAGPRSVAPFRAFAEEIDARVAEWGAVFAHAHESLALVEEMEQSHEHVVSKTQALYDSFENILQQVDALTTRVELIAAPMPHFVAIEGIAQALGFGAKFAMPSPASAAPSLTSAPSTAEGATTRVIQQPVQVFQHKRTIDPTTRAFAQALEKIDSAVAYLDAHREFKDTVCYIEAYRTLTAGAMQCLKEYAISGLDAARDAVQEAVTKSASAGSTLVTEVNETSPYYVNFQLVAPSLAAVAHQLDRLATSNAAAVDHSAYMTNVMALSDVCNAYAALRVQLLTPVLATYFETLSQGTDIANLLRLSGSYLVRVCDAEYRLFVSLFGRDPSDDLFVFKTQETETDTEDEDDETAFERLIFQLSGVLYNIIRPQMLAQKELEVLCEIVQVLQHEIIESIITPRAQVVGYVEPVMHRMIQDAQERLILCVQKYIRDEIEGFTPTSTDLDYPQKLIEASKDGAAATMYATWYPALEHTLLCLSKVYHFVNMDIFEELAQDAIQICTASLKMASADLSVAKGTVHGTLFLVKHLLTLREQITPFDIKFSVRSKALDFTSSSDALSHLLSDVTAIFSLSLQDNALVGLFTQGIPQIHETTSDVKKDLEIELKKSCTAFIDAVLHQIAEPLLSLMRQISAVHVTGEGPSNKSAHTDLKKHSFARPDAVGKTLEAVSKQINDVLPSILETIHLYLRNSSTENILFKPIQRNLLDAVDNLKTLLDQSFTREERQPCEAAFQVLLQQLKAI